MPILLFVTLIYEENEPLLNFQSLILFVTLCLCVFVFFPEKYCNENFMLGLQRSHLTTSKKFAIISLVKIKMLNFLIFALIYNVNIMKDGETNIDSKESWGEYLKKIRDAHPESDS